MPKQPKSNGGSSLPPAVALSDEVLWQFLGLITETLGIKMNASKRPMLQGRLQRRLRDLGITTIEEYHALLLGPQADPEEMQHFIDAVTTNKTDFFREPQHFAALVEQVLPELRPKRGPAAEAPWTCRVWSAPCASGEEPYTLAMVLAEHAARNPGYDFSILGTDVSARVLRHAERGVYELERIVGIPETLRSRYLLRAKDPERAEVRIVPELRRKVTFRQLNFMDRDYAIRETYDVIFCRNVLIYFDKPTQAQVIRRLAKHLRRDGFLFLGHSESLAGLDVPFTTVGNTLYRHSP